MEEIRQKAVQLKRNVDEALDQLHFTELDTEEKQLYEQMNTADFWQDPTLAQDVSKRQAGLARRISPWRELKKSVNDVAELASLGDESLAEDLEKQIKQLHEQFDAQKGELKLLDLMTSTGSSSTFMRVQVEPTPRIGLRC